jgi:hypothetical protein
MIFFFGHGSLKCLSTENLLSLGLNAQHRHGALHLGATIEENILVQKIIEIPNVIKTS